MESGGKGRRGLFPTSPRNSPEVYISQNVHLFHEQPFVTCTTIVFPASTHRFVNACKFMSVNLQDYALGLRRRTEDWLDM